jgi:hypothetical protein
MASAIAASSMICAHVLRALAARVLSRLEQADGERLRGSSWSPQRRPGGKSILVKSI